MGEEGNGPDAAVGNDDISLTLVPTWSSSHSPVEDNPVEDGKFAMFKRFRSQKGARDTHRTYMDEEALGGTES